MRRAIRAVLLFPSSLVDLCKGDLSFSWLLILLFSAVGAGLSMVPLVTGFGVVPATLRVLIVILCWPLIIFGFTEPVLHWFLTVSIRDEQEFHWRGMFRDERRKLLVFLSVVSLCIAFLAAAVSNLTPTGILAGMLLITCWHIAGFTVFFRVSMNFGIYYSISLAVILFSLAMLLLMLSSAVLVISVPTLLALATLAWFANHDLRIRYRTYRLLKSSEEALLSPAQRAETIELLFLSGSRTLAKRVHARYGGKHDDEDIPFEIRLMNLQWQFLEAIDLGLSYQEEYAEDPAFHLAMSEANFGARDADNAAAHAERAVDLAGGVADINGQEAHLFLALASFNLYEQHSGQASCEAIELAPRDDSARGKRIRRENSRLVRKFSSQNLPEESVVR